MLFCNRKTYTYCRTKRVAFDRMTLGENNMKKSMDIENQAIILEQFSDYLKQNQNVEILFSEKFGYIYIALWGIEHMKSYDAIYIGSAEQLCYILMGIMVDEHILTTEQICIFEEDAILLYYEKIEQYVKALPAYQDCLKQNYAKVIKSLICKSL